LFKTGKPIENSEWVLTTMDNDFNVVENSNLDMSKPNVGCMWKCSNGFKKQYLSGLDLAICIPEF
jgi:hypothetical protein